MTKEQAEKFGLYRVEKAGKVVFASDSRLEAGRKRDELNSSSKRGRGYMVVSGWSEAPRQDAEAVALRDASVMMNGALGGRR